MRKWRSLLLVVMCIVVAFGAMFVLAQEDVDETDDIAPFYDDGRLNSHDIDAPVVVYYRYDTQPGDLWDEYVEVVTGIELWRVTDEGVGQKILDLPVEELNLAVAEGETTFLTSVPGFELNVGTNGWMWVRCPGNPAGKIYTFAWDDLGRALD
jgi:hypothetical protein